MSEPLVLIADEDSTTREVVGLTLDDAGYAVTLAASAREAFEAMAVKPVSLVLTDLSLPGRNGKTFVRALQAHSPELPYVVFTAHSAFDAARQAKLVGATAFLNKPLDLDEVLQRVGECLYPAARFSAPEEARIALAHFAPPRG